MQELERKSADNHMAREQFRDLYGEMAAVMETSQVGIIMSQQGEITRINRTGAGILGAGPQDLVGEKITALLPLDADEKGRACHARLLAGHCIVDHECFFTGRTGASVAVRVSARPIDPADMERGVVWVFSDITREVEARRLREDVDLIIRHDLKAPLQAVLGAPELLLMEGNLNEMQEKLVRMIESSAVDMLDMINLSLDLYKMETGRYELHPEAVDLVVLVRKVAEELGALSRARKVEVDVQGPAPRGYCAFVWGEPLLLRSLLSNLLKNALEAAPAGSRVSIAMTPGESEWTVGICNRGAVPEEIRETFFEKYSTAGKKRGTGLGTYSAKLIAETLGGSIGLSSRADETVVRVTLPAAEGE